MVGEYQVLRSIIEYSIPKLIGWSTMFDRNIEQAIAKSVTPQGNSGGNSGSGGGGSYNNNRGGGYVGGTTAAGSPHNYQGGGGGS